MDAPLAGKLDTGQVGERVVTLWLRQRGYRILAERWHCRFGEIDIVAQDPQKTLGENAIAFIEVKTRRSQNWDLDGLLAITVSKRKKLIKTAQAYLAQHSEFYDAPCRFDVALVEIASQPISADQPIEPNSTWVNFGGDRLRVKNYLKSAFES